MLWDSVYFDFIVDEFDALHRYLNSSSTRELKKKFLINNVQKVEDLTQFIPNPLQQGWVQKAPVVPAESKQLTPAKAEEAWHLPSEEAPAVFIRIGIKNVHISPASLH